MIKKISISILFILLAFPLLATHITGLETRYLYVGQTINNKPKYRFVVGAYIDCSGFHASPYLAYSTNFPTILPIIINFSNSSTCSPTEIQPDWDLISWQIATPLCPSTTTICHTPNSPNQGRIYVEGFKDIVFDCPGVTSYEYSIQFCCTVGITTSGLNVKGALTGGEIFPASHNSSPAFPPVKELSFCAGDSTQFDLAVTDTNALNIKYKLAPVYDQLGQNGFISATYGAGYSYTNPLGPNYSVTIDSLTGILSIQATSPAAGHEYGIVGIKTTEFNWGKPPEYVVRYYGISTIQCDSSNNPISTNIGPPDSLAVNIQSGAVSIADTVYYCPGQLLSVNFSATDPDAGNTVDLIAEIDSLPGVSFSSLQGNPATGFFTWLPSANQDTNFSVAIKAYDNYCNGADTGFFEVFFSPYETAILSTEIDSSICGSPTGGAAVSLSNFFGPITYQWSNGSSTDSIINQLPGFYPLTITDLGCPGVTWQDTIEIPSRDLVLDVTVTPASCFNDDGMISVQQFGGTPPIKYQWNTGSLNPTISPLAPGVYQITAFDANLCGTYQTILLPRDSACFVSLSGITFLDLNGNCIRDSLEPTANYIPLSLSDGQQQASNWKGEFYFQSSEDTLDLSVLASSLFTVPCGTTSWSYIYTANGQAISGVEIPIQLSQIADLRMSMVVNGQVSPLNQTLVNMHALNNTVFTATQVKVVSKFPAAGIQISNIWPAPDTVDYSTGEITWVIGTLPPGQSQVLNYTFNSSPVIPIGFPFFFQTDVFPIINDIKPENNRDTATVIVMGPYDPNDKQVNPKGVGLEGYITPEIGKLEYTIRFQNTGNLPATYVMLRDTLSEHLLFSEFNHLFSSHNYSVALEEDSILVFTFANIGLPDSASDPEGSIGFVRFELGFDSQLASGTEIANQAAIYFDFNPPIFTNVTRNTIYRKPEVSISYPVSNPDTFCVGDTLFGTVLEGLPPYTWSWSSGEIITSDSQTVFIDAPVVKQGDAISLTVTDQLGNLSTDSFFVAPTNFPVAQFSYPPQSTPLEISFQNGSEYGTDYLWDFGDGNTSTEENPTHTFQFWGTYVVRLIATNLCGIDTFESAVEVLTTSMSSSTSSDGLHAWVDHAQKVIIVDNQTTHRRTIELFDLQGRLIESMTIEPGITPISTQFLSKGIYLIKGESSNGFYSQKLEIRN